MGGNGKGSMVVLDARVKPEHDNKRWTFGTGPKVTIRNGPSGQGKRMTVEKEEKFEVDFICRGVITNLILVFIMIKFCFYG